LKPGKHYTVELSQVTVGRLVRFVMQVV
uniref:Uncharacterized protein n=1 Tax=Amphimedon queenslandica TaxID=400682 RepID=A0A1X7SEI0_AMPQE